MVQTRIIVGGLYNKLTQIAFTGKKISEKLDNKTIRKGGCTIINIPIIECNLASEHESMTLQVGGYPSIINYNKHRERQHKTDKENKRFRSLKREIKRLAGCSNGEDLPSPSSEIHLNSRRGTKS